MIHHAIPAQQPLQQHACGNAPHLIESRGHASTDPRLFGLPASMYHVECCRCGLATTPAWSARTAEHLWATATDLVPTTRLQALRLEAERALAAAA
ncbi:MAG TPA: hypothetical protein VM619_14665 [Luteimonas sp.]|nr:hypothetical protein [Luteimonas sp.]